MVDENSREEYVLSGWQRFFSELSIFLNTADRQITTANQAYSEYVLDRLQISLVSMSSLLDHLQIVTPTNELQATVSAHYYSEISDLFQCVREIAALWERHLDEEMSRSGRSVAAYSAPTENIARGRPRFFIPREQLIHLASMSFTWTQISEILGVSRNTIYRRRLEYGLQDSRRENISDGDLRSVLLHLQREFPAMGEVMVWGRLQSMGFVVRRERLRRVIRQLDPLHTALRWRGELTNRRPYSVAGPNSLWHMDGHHKLIRWRFVTHCAIDGYSRLIVFIKCSDNNRASTVYESFMQAVRQYGLPSRIRCDQGGENVVVSQHMLHHRGTERRSVLVGSSVHNQRIERLWRDMHRCVTGIFYKLFYFLEHHNLLDPINENHLYALHYVYLPRINQGLQLFLESWNNHHIRTEGGKTPHQLFTAGALRLRNSGLVAVDFFDAVSDDYGAEEEGIAADDSEGVEIPPNQAPVTNEQLSELRQSVNPLNDSENFGIDIYQQALQVISTLL